MTRAELMADLERSPWRFPGCPEPPGYALDFDGLPGRHGWLRAMRGCRQEADWHAEGDVLAHTELVRRELVAMPEWRALPVAVRHVLFAAALLHDAGKPATTRVEAGRVRSFGHAAAGAYLARRTLMEMAVPFAVREQVVALVRHHGLPPMVLDKPDPHRAVVTAATTARLDWLSVLAMADARGRVCREPDAMPERVGLFRDVCDEVGCWDRPYPFPSAATRVRYFKASGTPLTADVYDAGTFDVTVMSGLPAAGKDTWLARHYDAGPVVSLDAIRAELDVDPADGQGPVVAEAHARAKALLRAKQPFAWNATNTGRPVREAVVNLFLAYGARVRLVYCESPLADLRERNARRPRPVPGRVIDKLLDRLDVPDETEADAVDYAV